LPEIIIENLDETYKVYNKGIIEGMKHTAPSPDTIKLIKKMEDKLDKISNKITEIEVKIAGLPERLLEKTDGKYACKETEKKLEELSDTMEQRNYEWLKYGITAILGAAMAYIMGNHF
jgi:predicted nuclease with TOPRIM domain